MCTDIVIRNVTFQKANVCKNIRVIVLRTTKSKHGECPFWSNSRMFSEIRLCPSHIKESDISKTYVPKRRCNCRLAFIRQPRTLHQPPCYVRVVICDACSERTDRTQSGWEPHTISPTPQT